MGIDWVCSIQHEGVCFWDQSDQDVIVRKKKKELGNKLDQAAKQSYPYEGVFYLYTKRGKYCEFQHPLT